MLYICTVFALGFVIWLLARPTLIWYVLTIAGPAGIAVLTVIVTLVRSGYVKTATELGSKRNVLERAGLGFIKSTTGKVLLNLQTKAPWEGMWCFPAGYFNREKGDLTTRETAARRTKELANVSWDCKAVAIARTSNGSPDYIALMLENGHTPTADDLFLMVKDGNKIQIKEEDVVVSGELRWCSAREVMEDRAEVPPHMKEIILYLLEGRRDYLRCWTLDPEYHNFVLANMEVGEVE